MIQPYAARFERRPEYLFDTIVKDVVDANVREYKVNDLNVARIEDVFPGKNETFFVFGKPNTALVVPMPNGLGYQKFAAYSFWRQKASIEHVTRQGGSYVQSGIWLRFVDVPFAALEALYVAMKKFEGQKFPTCVRGNMMVMDAAGFTSGSKKLTSITWPYQLMRTLLANGLSFQGNPIHFEVVRTTRLSMEGYTRSIIYAEATTPWRHFKNNRVGAIADNVIEFPIRRIRGKKQERAGNAEVAPALNPNVSYHGGLRVRVTMDSKPGQSLRQMWGPHALFDTLVERVNVDHYLKRPLRPFPVENPTFGTRVKKTLLFSKPVIFLMREVIGASNLVEIGVCNERDVYDMLRTHSSKSPNIYNAVVVRMPNVDPDFPPITRFIFSRVTVRSKLIDWVLSKHVLMSGYLWSPKTDDESPNKKKPYVVWAGEFWKTSEGEIHLRGNSGTYRPTHDEDLSMTIMMQAILPHLPIVKAEMP